MPKIPTPADGAPRPTTRTIDVVAQTNLRDVRRGKLLPANVTADFLARVDDIVTGFKLVSKFARPRARPPERSDKPVKTPADWVRSPLRGYAFYGDWEDFNCELERVLPGEFEGREAQDLWVQLTQLNGDLGGAATTVDLEVPQPALPPTGQLVVLRDDGKARTSVQLAGARDLLAEGVQAALFVGREGVDRIALAPLATIVDGPRLSLDFPSLKASKLTLAEGRAKQGEVVLKLAYAGASVGDSLVPSAALPPVSPTLLEAADYKTAVYVNIDPAKDPALELAVRADRIVAVGGEGKVAVGVKLTPGSPARAAVVQIEGAEIAAASAGQIDPLGQLRLEQGAYVTLSLRNLEPGKPVTVSSLLVQGDKVEGEKKTKTLPVVMGKEPEKRDTAAVPAATG